MLGWTSIKCDIYIDVFNVFLFINVTKIFLIDESFSCSVSQFVINIFDVVFYALLAEFFHSWNTANVKLLRLLLV